MGAKPSRLEWVGLCRLPIGGMPPAFRLFRFFERVADGAGCFYLAGGAGAANIGGGMGNEFAGWSKGDFVRWREKPKTALTAARGFCKLRKSWSKVRFRSETKPGRRRSAPGPENQIPIPYPLDPKTKFLSLTHADDTGLRESRRRIRSESRPSATKPRMLLVLVAAVIAMITSSTASAAPPRATLLLSGLEGGSGSTVGPGGALYVTESNAGRISRVDPRTGEITTFASGLPKSIIGIGGTIDVAFIGGTAYALVTLVGPDVGGSDIVGIYRIDGPDSFTVVADIGAFALNNPPATSVRRPDRSPVRAGDLPRRVPGHRWAPQPGLPGHPRRRGQRADPVRQHRPDRAGDLGQHDLHGRGGPCPPPPRGRQGGVVQAEVTERHRGGLRCPTPRRRGVRPRSRSVRALAGRVPVAVLRVLRRRRTPAAS